MPRIFLDPRNGIVFKRILKEIGNAPKRRRGRGLEKGMALGIEKGRVELAQELMPRLRAKGFSDEEIRHLLSEPRDD